MECSRILIAVIGLCASAFTVFAADAPYDALKTNPREPRSKNVKATDPYMKTQVQAQLRLLLDKDTDQVHFIRDNNDPYVVTKVYPLKYADPYEIRPFVRNAILANRVDSNTTTVECVKYLDGHGALVVSAEEYRFKKSELGMSVDEIVAALDKKKITSSSGQTTFLYFPKYWASRDLAQLIKNVGANVEGDNVELAFGRDSIQYDAGLNAILMYMPRYSRKNISEILKLYDTPTYEVAIKYSLYEIYAENDAKIGADFQAWKNNAGADLFSVGMRYRDGWSANWSSGVDKTGSSKTNFLNFNPKWNTRYLDFLASKGKAKVLTTGDLLVMNQATGQIEVKNNLFNFEDGDKIPNQELIAGYLAPSGDFVLSSTAAAAAMVDKYRIQAFDSGGNRIDISAPFTGEMTIAKISNSPTVTYYMKITEGAGTFTVGGKESSAWAFTLEICAEKEDSSGSKYYEWDTVSSWNTDVNLEVYKNVKINTKPAAADYGFSMSLTPEICEDSTIISLILVNDSLTGWNSDGTPRISRDTEIKTKIMVSNKGNKFVIGGIEKRSVVSSVSGVPFLKDIPILGYLFSTESESSKKSQLVLVLECEPQSPDTPVGDKIKAAVTMVNFKNKNAGNSIPYGSDQYLLNR